MCHGDVGLLRFALAGAIAERVSFVGMALYFTLFSLVIYCPLAHMTWHPEGLLHTQGVIDFAGGTVVHMAAGCGTCWSHW